MSGPKSPPLDRRGGDARVAQTIREVSTAVRGLLAAPTLQALTGAPQVLTFAAGTPSPALRVQHGLGRVPLGYTVVRRSANFTVYDGAFPATDDPTQVIYLVASVGGGTATVLFL